MTLRQFSGAPEHGPRTDRGVLAWRVDRSTVGGWTGPLDWTLLCLS